MGSIWRWWRWEASRELEVTPFIRLIIVERLVKGSALVAGGLTLLFLGSSDRFHEFTVNLQDQLNVANDASLLKRAVEQLLIKFGTAAPRTRDMIAAGAFLYGLLELVEAVGLIRRRRWAEYLVLVATVAFLPLEIDELLHRATVLKALALILNIAIVAYLIRSKRLFLERPDRGAEQPA